MEENGFQDAVQERLRQWADYDNHQSISKPCPAYTGAASQADALRGMRAKPNELYSPKFAELYGIFAEEPAIRGTRSGPCFIVFEEEGK